MLDQSGNVIGVVSSGLGKRYEKATGHIAQNVNFAIKSTILEGFLSSNKVPYETADSTEKLELPDIAEKVERFTVLVGCWERCKQDIKRRPRFSILISGVICP